MRQQSNFCWTAPIGWDGDDATDPVRSAFFIFEDGAELGPAHCSVAEISSLGMGRFCHWGTDLYFSSSDNSDPNTNGRCYELRYVPERQVQHFVRYAIGTADFYRAYIPHGWNGVAGKRILEIGPGRDLGAALILASLGARVTCIEKFHTGWDDGWHPTFLEMLLEALKNKGMKFDEGPMIRSLRDGRFDPETIELHACELENVPMHLAGTFDLSLSHAVFEHFEKTSDAMKALFNLTKPGGRGVHRIDLRDHRDFAKPLDFLLLSDRRFDKQTGSNKYTHGNRIRPREYISIIKHAEFRHVEFIEEKWVDSHYFASFMPRLRRSNSRYSRHSEDDLRCLGGIFVLQR